MAPNAKRITWKRTSTSDGASVTIDGYIDGKRIGTITNTTNVAGSRVWTVWHNKTGAVEGAWPSVSKAKCVLRSLVN